MLVATDVREVLKSVLEGSCKVRIKFTEWGVEGVIYLRHLIQMGHVHVSENDANILRTVQEQRKFGQSRTFVLRLGRMFENWDLYIIREHLESIETV